MSTRAGKVVVVPDVVVGVRATAIYFWSSNNEKLAGNAKNNVPGAVAVVQPFLDDAKIRSPDVDLVWTDHRTLTVGLVPFPL